MKQITNYPNYLASLDGRIYSLYSNKFLKQDINKYGYPQIALTKNGKLKTFTVHKLIAETYLNKTDERKYVNHIDGNKQNNMLCNLEYVSFKENIKHAWDNNLYENTRLSSLTKANKIVLDINTGIYYNSLIEASKYYSYRYKTLVHMLSGHSKNKSTLIYA